MIEPSARQISSAGAADSPPSSHAANRPKRSKPTSVDEVFDLLRQVGDLAETAQLENKSLFLWTDP